MIYAVFHILSMVAFHQLLYYSDRKGVRPVIIGAVNYLAGAVVLLAWFVLTGRSQALHAPSLILGTVNGILYVTHLFILIATYRRVGVGIATAIIGASVAAPVVLSWAVWAEPMTPWRWGALLLIPLALYLMRPDGTKTREGGAAGTALLVLCFLFAGAILCIHKAAVVYGGPARSMQYQTALFTIAAVYALIILAVKKYPVSRDAFFLGGLVGGVNVLVLVFLMLALGRIPAVMFYPTVGSLIIAGNTLAGRALWKDRMLGRQTAGIALTIMIVVAANI